MKLLSRVFISIVLCVAFTVEALASRSGMPFFDVDGGFFTSVSFPTSMLTQEARDFFVEINTTNISRRMVFNSPAGSRRPYIVFLEIPEGVAFSSPTYSSSNYIASFKSNKLFRYLVFFSPHPSTTTSVSSYRYGNGTIKLCDSINQNFYSVNCVQPGICVNFTSYLDENNLVASCGFPYAGICGVTQPLPVKILDDMGLIDTPPVPPPITERNVIISFQDKATKETIAPTITLTLPIGTVYPFTVPSIDGYFLGSEGLVFNLVVPADSDLKVPFFYSKTDLQPDTSSSTPDPSPDTSSSTPDPPPDTSSSTPDPPNGFPINPDYVGFDGAGLYEFAHTLRFNMGSAFSFFLYAFILVASVFLIPVFLGRTIR